MLSDVWFLDVTDGLWNEVRSILIIACAVWCITAGTTDLISLAQLILRLIKA